MNSYSTFQVGTMIRIDSSFVIALHYEDCSDGLKVIEAIILS